jgi:hypothetical protein
VAHGAQGSSYLTTELKFSLAPCMVLCLPPHHSSLWRSIDAPHSSVVLYALPPRASQYSLKRTGMHQVPDDHDYSHCRQMFYIHRIFMLSRKWWLAAPAFIADIFRWVISVVGQIVVIREGLNLPAFRARYSGIFYAALILGAFVSLICPQTLHVQIYSLSTS